MEVGQLGVTAVRELDNTVITPEPINVNKDRYTLRYFAEWLFSTGFLDANDTEHKYLTHRSSVWGLVDMYLAETVNLDN